MNKFIFDVDGTLTPSRQTINPEFKEFFKTFIASNKVWLVTGSDYPKTLEQLGADICEGVVTVYNCSGNAKLAPKIAVNIDSKIVGRAPISLPTSIST